MKNPFKKEKSSALLIAGIVGGAIAAGIITALIIRHSDELAEAAKEAKERATDYLHDKEKQLKKHKSDVDNLKEFVTQGS